MNVKELAFKGDEQTQLYACGKCGRVHSPLIYACQSAEAHEAARKSAEDCCAERHCACGEKIEKYWTACKSCREGNALRKAKAIEPGDYDGPVSAQGISGEWGEGYSSNIATLLEYCDGSDEEHPAFCHPCTEHRLHIDADAVLEHAADGMHEGAHDQIVDADEFYAFVKAWNEKQTCVSWSEDSSRVIVLDERRFADLISDTDKPET